MNRLESHRRPQRFARFQRSSIVILLSVGSAIALLGLLARIPWLHVSAVLQQHSALVNIALAAGLVGITAFYAYTTAATLHEMRAARAAGIRPHLKTRLGHFRVRNEPSSAPPQLRLEGTATVSNFGRGPAIDIRLTVTVPWKRDSDKEEYIRLMLDPIPALEPGCHTDVPSHIFVYPYEVSFADEAFFEVDASFEDIEANLYEIKQFYDLHPIRGVQPDEQEWRSHLRFEDLRLVVSASSRRRRRGVRSSSDVERVLIERG